MTFKRRNGGCNKHGYGHTVFIHCFNRRKCFPKDKAIKRFLVKNIVEQGVVRDFREDACAFEPYDLDIPITSSNSTNSLKGKRESLPLNESPGHGKIFFIKLSTKQDESNAFANANKMQPCSKSGNTNAVKMDDSNSNMKFGRENSSPTRKIDGRQISSTSQHVDGVTEAKTIFPSVPKARQDGYNVANKNSSSPPKNVGEKICSTSKPVESLSKAKIGLPYVPKAQKKRFV